MRRFILLIVLAVVMCLSAIAHNFMFKHLEVRDGMPSNQINVIYKDSRGFMWFGTASGLARYDGYRFKVFYSSDNDPTSLPDSYIEKIVEDGEGRLWIRTGENGYIIYNWNTENFVRDVRSWMWNIGIDGTPRHVFVDSQKNMWFAVDGKGCYRYSLEEKKADVLPFGEKGIPEGIIIDMIECKDGVVLVYDNGHVFCIDREEVKVKWELTEIMEEMGNHTDIFFLYVDKDEDLWIYGAPGVWAYNLPAKKWQSQWNFNDRGQAHVVAIAQDRQGRIWFGKDQDGIDIWNKATGKTVSLTYNVDDERGLPNNTINVFYEDDGGVMWIGTYKKGVAYYNESIFKFSINRLGDINCMEECGDGCLWLGSNDAGLMHWNSLTDEKKIYTHARVGNSIASNVIVTLLQATDGKLWIGTFWEGLDCFDGKRFVNYRNHPGDENTLANNNVWSLAEDKDGNIWIGTLGGGLQCLNPKTGKFITYTMANSDLISNHISSICITHDNRLVIGTASTGVAIMDLNTRKITNMVGNLSGNQRFSNQSINQVYEDSRGLIWIGTRNGLNLYNPKNDHLQIVSSGQDEAKEYIAGIAEDEDKIGKVVMNLLSNAFKFTPDGGRVDVSLELLKGATETLEIKVSDTGVGISDVDKERIFERFYQTECKGEVSSTTGSGIGLSLVRDYVTLHGGVVRVFDNVGTGSVFVVDIPVKHSVVNVVTPLSEEAAEEEAAVLALGSEEKSGTEEQSETEAPDENEKKKPLALIVDDNEDFVSFMRYTLSLYFRIESAGNGKIAWQMIPELMPDIIVCDVMMPEMDGNELCRWVKADKRTSNIPFVLLTAKQSVENKVEGLTIGADDYVTKPFNMEVLILRMRKLIDLSSKNKLRTRIDPEPSEIVITSMDEKLIENAIKYVETHIARPDLSVEELSHELGMSRVHLYKKLLQITGKTPIEFIRIIRLKRAAQLLRESQQNVSEVAYQVGFNNPKYFSKYFKDEFGVLPSVYQEKEGK